MEGSRRAEDEELEGLRCAMRRCMGQRQRESGRKEFRYVMRRCMEVRQRKGGRRLCKSRTWLWLQRGDNAGARSLSNELSDSEQEKD